MISSLLKKLVSSRPLAFCALLAIASTDYMIGTETKMATNLIF